MMLKDILKQEGRSQKWLRMQLALKGVTRDHSMIHRYCWNKSKPKDDYVINLMAEILGINKKEIEACFEDTGEELIF